MGETNSWRTTFWLYSNGMPVCTRSFNMDYKDLTGKDVDTSSDAAYDEFLDTVDLYNSLFSRGEPVVTVKVDYHVEAVSEQNSKYRFVIDKVHVIDTVTGAEKSSFSMKDSVVNYESKPSYAINVGLLNVSLVDSIIARQVEEEKKLAAIQAEEEKKLAAIQAEEEKRLATIQSYRYAILALQEDMITLPGKNLKMLKTEVTQALYMAVMGDNPSYHKGDTQPVEQVSWYETIYFCNKLSTMTGLNPVYAVDDETDFTKWKYNEDGNINGTVTQNTSANGYRLPTEAEWVYAAKGGQNYTYAGSNKLAEVGWYGKNSKGRIHPVGTKKSNGFGLYDMSGNVWEWCWGASGERLYYWGGSYGSTEFACEVDNRLHGNADYQSSNLGFRIVCSPSK